MSCSDHYDLHAGMANFTPVQAGGSRDCAGQPPASIQFPGSVACAAPGDVCRVLPHNRCRRLAAWSCIACDTQLYSGRLLLLAMIASCMPWALISSAAGVLRVRMPNGPNAE